MTLGIRLLLVLATAGSLASDAVAQIVFRELPAPPNVAERYDYLVESSKRRVVPLNGAWRVAVADEEDAPEADVSIPAVFVGDEPLVFTREFFLDADQIRRGQFRLRFLGVSYAAEISLNGSSLHRHAGGDFPFSTELPKDLLLADEPNVVAVKILPAAVVEAPVPGAKLFLHPERRDGVFRDVFIVERPNVRVEEQTRRARFSETDSLVWIDATTEIANSDYAGKNDEDADLVTLRLRLYGPEGDEPIYEFDSTASVPVGKERTVFHKITVRAPRLWSPENPQRHRLVVSLEQDERVVDQFVERFPIYKFAPEGDELRLNGEPVQLLGAVYVPSYAEFAQMATHENLEQDLKIVKETGLNAVRFRFGAPHPYALELCERLGLLAFVDLPFDETPESFAENADLMERRRTYARGFFDALAGEPSVAAFGLGSSYFGASAAHRSMIEEWARIALDAGVARPLYASFSDFHFDRIEGVDLYGGELLQTPVADVRVAYENAQSRVGVGAAFLASAGYIADQGAGNGYLSEHTFEAQARFFELLLAYSEATYHAGFFINAMFDYRLDYQSVVAGYDENRVAPIGLLGEDRSPDRIGYRVVHSSLNRREETTVPQGAETDDSPMIFILFGLGLALLVGLLVNSGRKFREDAARALLRPYNFFADVRDLRVISGGQTAALGAIVSAVGALVVAAMLHGLKYSVVFEKVALAVGVECVVSAASFLAWNPALSLIYLTIIFYATIALAALLVKAASGLVMNKVMLSSSFYATIWAFLPSLLLIPVAIVLYRVLQTDVSTLYVYLALAAFLMWQLIRLIKGMYVIYDAPPSAVYIYSILAVVALVAAALFYLQSAHSTIDYALRAIAEADVGS
jgi:beta-galactosidase